jgi:septal ring factor EnvC (AmiA/AmiB activator)
MHKLSKPILAIAGLATLAIAMPAAAASTPARANAVRNQIAELDRRINRNDNRDHISEREAAGLRNDVDRLQNQFRDFNRNGLSNGEYRTLQGRIDDIRTRLHIERSDWDKRRW